MGMKLFHSPQFGNVRTAGTPDYPEFCLSDVCTALELDTANVRRRLSDGVCTVHPTVDALGRTQPNTYINEDGLFDVILDSRKPEARAFRKWITSEVLPTIRKTGAYATTEVMERAMNDPDYAIRVFQQIKDLRQQNKMLEGRNALLQQENKALAPKAQYTDQVLQAKNTYTHTEMAKELNYKSCVAFIDACKKDGILFKQSGIYMLYSKYAGKGYMKTKTTPYQKSDGSIGTNTISVWTETGRKFLHEHFAVEMQPVEIAMFEPTIDL